MPSSRMKRQSSHDEHHFGKSFRIERILMLRDWDDSLVLQVHAMICSSTLEFASLRRIQIDWEDGYTDVRKSLHEHFQGY